MKVLRNNTYWIALALAVGLSIGLISTQPYAQSKSAPLVETPVAASTTTPITTEVDALENTALKNDMPDLRQSTSVRALLSMD